MGGEREVKECPICLDGVEYPKNVGECPKCKNFLRMKKKSANTTVNDDFADVFDNTFYEEKKPTPPNKTTDPFESTYTEQQTSAARETIKVSKAKRNGSIKGQVSNFQEDVIPGKMLGRWFDACIKGIPFMKDGYMNTFQVYDQDGEGHEVVVYGKIVRGKIGDHNLVQVFGKRDRHGTVVAKHIENLNSNTTVSVNSGMSANSVRFLTAIIIFLLFSIINFVISFDWIGLVNLVVSVILTFLSNIFVAILPLIIVLFGIWIMIKKVFR